MSNNNLATVQQMYASFGQGDIPSILAKMADNVRLFNSADPAIVPFAGTFQGKAEAVRYFTLLGQTTQTTHVETSNFHAEGNQVTNNFRHEGIVLSTGKPFSVTMLFTWGFNDAGQAADWKASGDFSSLNAAFSN